VSALLVSVTGVLLVAAVSLAVPSMLRIRGRAPFAVAALITAAGDVVGVSIGLSPAHWLTRAGMLVGLAIVAAGTLLAWDRLGRPSPPDMSGGDSEGLGLNGAARFMLIVAGVALLIQLYVGVRVAPSNWDSMTYHLSRAAYWLQYHSVGQYPGATIRQAASPPNAEILQAWTMLLTGTDRWVEVVQWLALTGIALTTYTGARLLRFSPSSSAFAAALFVVLPEPILQSTTTQNDLVVSFFIAAAAMFMVRGMRDGNLGDLAIAGAATGLAVGTKGTALLAGPALLVIVLAALRAYRPNRRVVVATVGFAVAGITVLGAFNYILNVVNRHDALGGVQQLVGAEGSNSDRLSIAVQDLWTFADAPGINAAWIEQIVERPAKSILGGIAGQDWPFTVRTTIQEDTTAYGLIGFLVFPVVLLVALLSPRASPGCRVLACAVVVSLLVFALNVADPRWAGRLIMPSLALGAPLLAFASRGQWSMGVVSGAAILSLVPCVLQNPQKPLLVPPGQQTVFDWSRITQMTFTRPEMAGVLRAFNARTHPNDALAFVGAEDSWDYPFFGAPRTHRIERFPNGDSVTYKRMSHDHLAGAVFANVGQPPQRLMAIRIGPDYYWVPARPAFVATLRARPRSAGVFVRSARSATMLPGRDRSPATGDRRAAQSAATAARRIA
jgi:Dolichyl-phosphate-mannose-protein mannosyltransferase